MMPRRMSWHQSHLWHRLKPRFHPYARGRGPTASHIHLPCKKDTWDISMRTRPDQSGRPRFFFFSLVFFGLHPVAFPGNWPSVQKTEGLGATMLRSGSLGQPSQRGIERVCVCLAGEWCRRHSFFARRLGSQKRWHRTFAPTRTLPGRPQLLAPTLPLSVFARPPAPPP
ncbi:hypothetical protein B0T13DRAFT_112088 [Neurospora crassa]|nr:hypothetical protein B0T13DRAFT_112088 [Neurospora crassa]